jgi:hypothetical protein
MSHSHSEHAHTVRLINGVPSAQPSGSTITYTTDGDAVMPPAKRFKADIITEVTTNNGVQFPVAIKVDQILPYTSGGDIDLSGDQTDTKLFFPDHFEVDGNPFQWDVPPAATIVMDTESSQIVKRKTLDSTNVISNQISASDLINTISLLVFPLDVASPTPTYMLSRTSTDPVQNKTFDGTNVFPTTVVTKGGTNQTTYAVGDILYSSATNTLSKLGGNTSATKKFLTQTGNGSISAAPGWNTATSSDVGLGNVENTAVSTWAGSTNITTLGTIATGVFPQKAYAKMTSTSTFTQVVDDTNTTITWDNEIAQVQGNGSDKLWVTGANTRFTNNTSITQTYSANFGVNAPGLLYLKLRYAVDGIWSTTDYVPNSMVWQEGGFQQASFVFTLNAGSYVVFGYNRPELRPNANANVDQTVSAGSYLTITQI